MDRDTIISETVALLDDPMFTALQEPSRVLVLKRVMLVGPADVQKIAEALPQERSVVSRHLHILREAGILKMRREGRHRIYEVDGPTVLNRFEAIVAALRKVVPFCCCA